MVKKPELLAPAGSMESLRAALAAGADAVYFGGTSFSNRMRAKNFDGDRISDAIKLCHSCGAKAYITINTRVRDREMGELLSFAERILPPTEDSCDAVIAADFGAALEIKKHFPHVILHASTQTSMSSLSDCLALRDIGFSRLVIPRELSFDEIRTLSEKSPIELEMFVHGAHCVSLSGQCLLSAVMGGRSGNRGECAQPCRLPYKKDGISARGEEYPLSLADMCLAGRMRGVLSSGVCSLKIEGRLKPAGYVYGVTKVYRALIDEERDAAQSEISALAALFTRGFTDGYFVGKYGNMRGIKNSGSAEITTGEVNAALEARLRSAAESNAAPVSLSFHLSAAEPSRLTLECGGASVTVLGDVPSAAVGKPLGAESALKNLSKLGGTGFRLDESKASLYIEDGLWMPVSSLNELRRRAVHQLTEVVAAEKVRKNKAEEEVLTNVQPPSVEETEAPTEKRGVKICVLETRSAANQVERGKFARVYAQIWDYSCLKEHISECGAEPCAVLPVLTPSDEVLADALRALVGDGCRRVMCHTAGQVYLARSLGFVCDMSFRANVTNAAAYRYCKSIGCADVTLSPELPDGAVRAIGGGAAVYGRLPLMHLSRCLGLEKCEKCVKKCLGGRARGVPYSSACAQICRGSLTDRVGAVFPIIGQPDCVNVIYNSVSLDKTAKMAEELRGASHFAYYLM